MEQTAKILGSKALWGSVGYEGDAHAPAEGTYPGIDALNLRYTTVADSGIFPTGSNAALANLTPLVMAALYDIGFAWEAGPTTSWSN